MSYNTARPYLAVFVILRKNGKIAGVLRSHTDWMNGHYGVPAGKAEIGERALAAAVREAREEAGVEIKEEDLQFVHLGHRWSDDNTLAWVDIFFEAKKWKGEPKNAEPHKHGELTWLDPKHLPENIVPAFGFYIQQIEAGKNFSEHGWKD